MQKTSKTGSFGKGDIISELLYTQDSTDLVIFFHGCCSSPYGLEKTNTQLISELLLEENTLKVSCGFFESSRNERAVDAKPEDFFAFSKRSFKGKTFQQELQDVIAAVETVIEEFKIKQKTTPRVHFVGFSLGGLLSILASKFFAPASITTFGTALTFNTEVDTPIIGEKINEPIQQDILETAKDFKGILTVVRGTEDDTASELKALELFQGFTHTKMKSLIEWNGVDHRFKQINSVPSADLVKQMKSIVLDAVLNASV